MPTHCDGFATAWRAGVPACTGVLLISLFRSVTADDAGIGRSLLDQGKTAEAGEYIARAWKSDSTSSVHSLLYAMVQADGHRAAHLYRRVASDTGAAGTVRSEACARLGDFRYAAGEYDEACGWYKEAWTLDPRPGFARLYARCAIARGDIEEAEAVLVPLTHSDEPSISAMSWYYLGSASMARGDYGQAVKYLANASRGSGEEFAAAARAAAGEATALSTDTKTERQAFADTAERQPGGKTGPGPYSLQVGAFGSVENARRFREEMKEKVDDVTISSTTAGGVTLYRVRIGSFRSREDAEVFGAAKLKKHGIGYHITGGTEQ